jgi:hypothetical protein
MNATTLSNHGLVRPGLSGVWMRAIRAASAAACFFGLSACAASVRQVDIDSKPSGAVVYINGENRGTARTKVDLDFGPGGKHRVLIQIVKPRYKPVLQYWTIHEVSETDKKVFMLEAD